MVSIRFSERSSLKEVMKVDIHHPPGLPYSPAHVHLHIHTNTHTFTHISHTIHTKQKQHIWEMVWVLKSAALNLTVSKALFGWEEEDVHILKHLHIPNTFPS